MQRKQREVVTAGGPLAADAGRIIDQEVAGSAERVVGVGNGSGGRPRRSFLGRSVGRFVSRPFAGDQTIADATAVSQAGTHAGSTVRSLSGSGAAILHGVAPGCWSQKGQSGYQKQNSFHGLGPIQFPRGLLLRSSASRLEKFNHSL